MYSANGYKYRGDITGVVMEASEWDNSLIGLRVAPVISVDFGTSTNFDVVDASGAYIGGAIAPGLRVSELALINATAALRRQRCQA